MTSKALRLSGLAKELDALAAASSSTLVVYEYTATANQTVFSGVDNNGLTLNYIGPNALVLYNEGMLQKTVDYVTTSSSVLTLTLGAEAGALVRVYAFGTFAVADVYTKAESDTRITNLALKSASKADILGTVAQTSGVPTGALYETGLGATGRFVKYADGTMICTFVQTITLSINTGYNGVYYGLPSWTYPSAFAESPTVNLNAARSAGVLSTGSGSATTTVAAQYVIDYISTTGQSVTLRWTAIGRWFV